MQQPARSTPLLCPKDPRLLNPGLSSRVAPSATDRQENLEARLVASNPRKAINLSEELQRARPWAETRSPDSMRNRSSWKRKNEAGNEDRGFFGLRREDRPSSILRSGCLWS